MYSYDILKEMIKKSKYSKIELCLEANISNTVIQRIRRNQNVTVKSLDKLYKVLCKNDEYLVKFFKPKCPK